MNGWTFTWQGGRQLAGMTNGTTTLSFAYNDSGLRTSKTVGNTTHTYTYQGSTLIADVTATDALYFHYDQNGSILGFTYDDGTTSADYYYVKNLQGDILGILDSSGALVASYTYDAWGNVLTATDTALANRNPIRYRGYYYDVESDLYYLQSRYYDAAVGRFINADSFASTGDGILGHNTYAYCNNNPVSSFDPTGHGPKSWIKDFVGNVMDPCVDKIKQVWATVIPGTVTVGENVSAAFGAYVGFSRGIAMDRDGNIGWALTGTVGAGTPAATAGVFVATTNAPNIDSLKGWSEEAGGSFPIGGYEKTFMINEDSPNGYYHGHTFSLGPQVGIVPAELHATASYTIITGKANIFAPYDAFSSMVRNW